MKLFPSAKIISEAGGVGVISRVDHSRSEVEIRLNDGRVLIVPSDVLESRGNDQLFLPRGILDDLSRFDRQGVAEAKAARWMGREGGELVIPVVEEKADIAARPIERGRIEIKKEVIESKQIVTRALAKEVVNVERVEVNRYLEDPISPRVDGDVTVIPVLEEVLVVSKKILLREEIHIKKERKVVEEPVEVSCRKEVVTVSRKPPRQGRGGDDAH